MAQGKRLKTDQARDHPAPGNSRTRSRPLYFLLLFAVALLGLGSRKYGGALPPFLAEYAGDTLWALAVFLCLGALLPSLSTPRLAGIALAISYLDEISQLYQAPWINAIRRTPLGHLALGSGFLWSDMACYTAGVLLGATLEAALGPIKEPEPRSFDQ